MRPGILQCRELVKQGCLSLEGEAKVSANKIGRPNGHTQHDEAALGWIQCRISVLDLIFLFLADPSAVKRNGPNPQPSPGHGL